MTDWGLALKLARTKAKKNQTEAAKLLGVTQPYLSMVEQGHHKLGRELIEKAALTYGLKVSELAELGE